MKATNTFQRYKITIQIKPQTESYLPVVLNGWYVESESTF